MGPQEFPLKKSWKPLNFHLDTLAAFKHGDKTAQPVRDFFQKDEPVGPWRVQFFSGRGDKEFGAYLETVIAEHEAAMAAAVVSTGDEIKIALKAEKAAQHKAAMSKAKDAAVKALQRSRNLRIAAAAPAVASAASGPPVGLPAGAS